MGGSLACIDSDELEDQNLLRKHLQREVKGFSEASPLDDNRTLSSAAQKPSQLADQTQKEAYAKGLMRFFKGLVKRCLLLHLQGKIHCDLRPQSIYLLNRARNNLLSTSAPGLHEAQVKEYKEIPAGRFPVNTDTRPFLDPAVSKQGFDTETEQRQWPHHLHKSMVYSLGALLFYCLVGRPFEEPEEEWNSQEELIRQLDALQYNGPTGQMLVAFVVRAMHRDISSRLSWATICMEWLKNDTLASVELREYRLKLTSYDDLYQSISLVVDGVQLADRVRALRGDGSVARIGYYGSGPIIPRVEKHPDQMVNLGVLEAGIRKVLAIDFLLLKRQYSFIDQQGLLTTEEKNELNEKMRLLVAAKYEMKSEEKEADYLKSMALEREKVAATVRVSLIELLGPQEGVSDLNALRDSFSRPNAYPLFGLVYAWVYNRDELLGIKHTVYLGWRGALSQDEEHKRQHKIGVRQNTFLIEQSTNKEILFNFLAQDKPEYLIEPQASIPAGSEAKMFRGKITSPTSSKAVVYKLFNKEVQNKSAESEKMSKITSPHVLKPIANLLLKIVYNEQTEKETRTLTVFGPNQTADVPEPRIQADNDPEIVRYEFYMVSDYIPYGTLENYVKNFPPGQIPPKLVLFFIKGVIAGMRAMRAKDVTHRDLKPANIMLGERYVPVIIDLGISTTGNLSQRLIEGDNQAADFALQGTKVWSAPELIADSDAIGLRLQDDRADIWSVGMILYYLMHRQAAYNEGQFDEEYKAFCANRQDQRFAKFIDHNPSRVMRSDEESLALQEIYERCIVFDKEERMSWASLLNHRLIQAQTPEVPQSDMEFTARTEEFIQGVNWVFNCKVLHKMLEMVPAFGNGLQGIMRTLSQEISTKVEELEKQLNAGIQINVRPFRNQHERSFYLGISQRLFLLNVRQPDAQQEPLAAGQLLSQAQVSVRNFKALAPAEQNSEPGEQLKPLLGYLVALAHDRLNAYNCFTIYPESEGPAQVTVEKFMACAEQELRAVIECNGMAFYRKYCRNIDI